MLEILNSAFPSSAQLSMVVSGVRNAYNSWEKSDSEWYEDDCFQVGNEDMNLMKWLANAGDDHGKFMRMLPVILDIDAPLYWWKEMDTYKIGTVANSCSTMHTITSKEFVGEDFSIDDPVMRCKVVAEMNDLRNIYLREEDKSEKKRIWRTIIQTLPESYNQMRTWSCNYQVLKHIYHARKGHKLSEWETLRKFIRENIPYSELITGEGEEP